MVDANGSLVRRVPDQIACDMGGEVVILDLKSGTHYGLNAVAARIWNLIEEPMSVAAIKDAIVAQYGVDPVTCERDIGVFLRQMQDARLIEVSGESASLE